MSFYKIATVSSLIKSIENLLDTSMNFSMRIINILPCFDKIESKSSTDPKDLFHESQPLIPVEPQNDPVTILAFLGEKRTFCI